MQMHAKVFKYFRCCKYFKVENTKTANRNAIVSRRIVSIKFIVYSKIYLLEILNRFIAKYNRIRNNIRHK